MLVLSRVVEEEIVISDNIVVKIVGVRGDKVRIGVTAPPEVSVHRREVYDAIKLEGKEISEAIHSKKEDTQEGRKESV